MLTRRSFPLPSYGILHEKGYQEFDEIRSSVSTKVKGIIFDQNKAFGKVTWDVADYVIPPQVMQRHACIFS